MKENSAPSKNYEYFICATKHMIKHGGKNGGKLLQKDFAKALDCSAEHLSGILSPRQARKASLGLQEKIATYFEMPLISYLDFGRTLCEGTNSGETSSVLPGDKTGSSARRRYSDNDVISQVSAVVNELQGAHDEIHRLNSIIENLGESLAILDKDGVFVFQNTKSREMFGRSFVGKHFREVIKETETVFVEGESSAVGRCYDSLVSERAISWTYDMCIASMASPLLDNSGELQNVIFVAKDITQRQKLMDENKALVARLSEAISMLDRGVLLYDENRNILFTNAKYRERTGMTGDEKTVDEIANLQESRGVKNLTEIRESMFRAFVERTETSVICYMENGEKTIYSARPMFNHDGKFIGMLAIMSPVVNV